MFDLKEEVYREIARRVGVNADGVIEGFCTGVILRLGLGPDDLRTTNAHLVYGRMTGWGQTGPRAKQAGHDFNYAALTGALWYASGAGDRPQTPPTVVGDIGGGALYLVIGMLTGILRARDTYDQLDTVSRSVLSGDVTDETAGKVLSAIARDEDMSGRIRRNVMDTRRAVSFMMRARMLNADQFEDARQILRDLDSLDSHTAFLFDKINFLMDATVGFININQNKIIKIFSVASVALLPPTLIASLYGMNFRFMPETEWAYGYPMALAMMACSAIIPMLYFRKRGWLG